MAKPNVGLEPASPFFDDDGDNSAQAIKTTPGLLLGLEVSNLNVADAFLQLFDLATTGVTVGTTVPALSLLVPAGNGTDHGAMDKEWLTGLRFGVAITYACTTTPTGNGDPTTGLNVNAIYQ